MVKIRILGDPQTQHQIGNHFVAGQTVRDVSKEELKNYKGFYVLEGEPSEISKTPKSKKYTEKELYDMNKAKQVEILNKLKVEKIPRLEKGRVEAILEAQK